MRAGARDSKHRSYPQAEHLRRARATAASVTLEEAERAGLDGPRIAARLREKRIAALKELQAKQLDPGR